MVSVATSKETALVADLDLAAATETGIDVEDPQAPDHILEAPPVGAEEIAIAEGATLPDVTVETLVKEIERGAGLPRLARAKAALAATARAAMDPAPPLDQSHDLSAAADPSLLGMSNLQRRRTELHPNLL